MGARLAVVEGSPELDRLMYAYGFHRARHKRTLIEFNKAWGELINRGEGLAQWRASEQGQDLDHRYGMSEKLAGQALQDLRRALPTNEVGKRVKQHAVPELWGIWRAHGGDRRFLAEQSDEAQRLYALYGS